MKIKECIRPLSKLRVRRFSGLLDILRNLIYSLKPNIFCPIFVSSSQRLTKVASPPLHESTTVDSKNLPRKSLIFLSKAGYARCLFWPIFDSFCGDSIRNKIQSPQKESKTRLKRTRKSTEPYFRKRSILGLLILFFSPCAFAHIDFDFYFKKNPPVVNVDYENLAEKNIVIATKRLEFQDFPKAHNPSMIKVDQGYLLSFRFVPDEYDLHWLSYIGIVLLNDSLEPISKPELLNTRPNNSKTPSQAEDARLFSYRGRLFLIYNDNIEVTAPTVHQRRDMFIAELYFDNGRYKMAPGLKLVYEEKYDSQYWQKNWIPFVHDNTLFLSYMLNPHEVLYPNLLNGQCCRFYESSVATRWKLGRIRGSTSPLFIDGEYLAFFHSGIPTSSPFSDGYELWHYFMGAYTFSAEPPFQLTKMTHQPIIGKGFYTHSDRVKRVIFPGGLVESGDKLFVAYGKDDCEVWIATIDKKELKKALVPINEKDNN